MLDSNQIEAALTARGFILEVDNTHARGFRSDAMEHLIYVKTSRNKKDDALDPVSKQPLVIHWLFKNHPKFQQLANILGDINLNYCNHNMRGFAGPSDKDMAHGLALNVASVEQLDNVLNLLGYPNIGEQSILTEIELASPTFENEAETIRQAIINARLGQGKFRKDLITYWGSCSVTNCSVIPLLRASHIKPWVNSNNVDRLNHFNGLLLIPNLDVAFDQGLISFDDEGLILIKRSLISEEDGKILGISQSMRLRKITDQHRSYLAHHRQINHF